MAENKFTAELTRVLRSQGAMVQVMQASVYTEPGWPDRLVVHPLWSGLIECKDADTAVEELQEHRLSQLHRRWPRHAVLVRRVPWEAEDSPMRGTSACSVSYVDDRDQWQWACQLTDLANLLKVLSAWSTTLERGVRS